jgi:type I restriction enzyme M protein
LSRTEPEDVLFIDASAYFEKAKNQNYLRNRDVDQIILTYRKPLEADKYSHRALLVEMAENDFNLNIPRYADTFEEEKLIHLAAVVREIWAVDEGMAETDQLIRRFCEELGIEALF